MSAISKREADAYDRMIDAAAGLAELISSHHIQIDEYDLEELTIYLASNAPALREMLKGLKMIWPWEPR